MSLQELDCTECNGKFEFNMSFQRDGNYRIVCPFCSHEHFRMVRDGRITGDRWASSSTLRWDRVMAEKLAAAPKPRRPRRARTIRRPGPPQSIYTGPTPIFANSNNSAFSGITVNGNTTVTGVVSGNAAGNIVYTTSGATFNTSATTAAGTTTGII